MQQIYLKTWLQDNLIINGSLFISLISLLILWVKEHCGKNKKRFIVGYNAHTRASQIPAAKSLPGVVKWFTTPNLYLNLTYLLISSSVGSFFYVINLKYHPTSLDTKLTQNIYQPILTIPERPSKRHLGGENPTLINANLNP